MHRVKEAAAMGGGNSRASRKVVTSAVQESGGIARFQKYGHLWQQASLDEAILRHAGPNATS